MSDELARLAALEGDLATADEMPPPAEVASAFPKSRQMGPSRILIWLACAVVAVGVCIQIAGLVIFSSHLRVGPLPLFTVALPIMIILLVSAGLIDYRLPRSMRTAYRPDRPG
ncbi:hypothetical protein [Frondihabitans sp. PAMC 28766]|uniref:hypothetical protein n=1 Tax=Frondihabitans sp. PAMC 28766 TaxID=1795630 RepID=UPI0012FFAA66|nr:hypothetical protein [Frondihabitans sp. PAMC 28766]